MKTVSLIGSCLCQNLRSAKMLFFLYLFSSVICGTGMLYLYGNFTWMMRIRNDQTTSAKSFSVYFPQEEIPLYADVEESIQELLDEMKVPLSSCYVRTLEDGGIDASLYKNVPVSHISGARDFEGREDEAVAIIPHFFPLAPDELNLEENTLVIRNVSLKIVGKHSGSSYIIPIKLFRKLNYSVAGFVFVLTEKPNSQMVQEISFHLQEKFPAAEVGSALQKAESAAYRELPTELFLICLAYGVSSLSFAYLLKYLMDQHLSENIVYSLVGASKKAVIRLIVLENLLLSSLSAVLSIGLHLLLKESVLDKFSKSVALTYRFSDYVLLFLLMVVVS
ncbi:MAG: hypothetical protein HFJ80_02525, partial [Clostridiales bacterium]|nr:hypothetical protein [Clostridiales bacterium]